MKASSSTPGGSRAGLVRAGTRATPPAPVRCASRRCTASPCEPGQTTDSPTSCRLEPVRRASNTHCATPPPSRHASTTAHGRSRHWRDRRRRCLAPRRAGAPAAHRGERFPAPESPAGHFRPSRSSRDARAMAAPRARPARAAGAAGARRVLNPGIQPIAAKIDMFGQQPLQLRGRAPREPAERFVHVRQARHLRQRRHSRRRGTRLGNQMIGHGNASGRGADLRRIDIRTRRPSRTSSCRRRWRSRARPPVARRRRA